MSQNYDLTPLAAAERNVNRALRLIASLNNPRHPEVRELVAPLVTIHDLVDSSLGGVLPEECIFDDAPYPATLLCDEVGEIRGYIKEAHQLFQRVSELVEGSPEEISPELGGYIRELGKALQSLYQTLTA